MKKLYITLIACLCTAGMYGQPYTCESGSVSPGHTPQSTEALTCSKNSTAYINHYRLQQSYVPDAGTPVKTIKIAFHIWQDANGGGNWINTSQDINFLNSIASDISNQFFNANDAPSDPLPGVPFISDSKIRVSLENIYFYQDGALHGDAWNHLAMNAKAKNLHPECVEYLNIHFAGSSTANFGLMSVDSYGDYHIATSGGGDGTGTGSGNGWAASQHLSHEIGHALGLCHTWSGSFCTESVSSSYLDLLTDVFAGPPYSLHQSAWGMDPYDPSNTATNNMMGSTFMAGYFSPLQMGRMHRELSLDNVRKYATGYSTTPLEITSNEVWDFETKLYRNIVVKSGATLTIKCLVRFVKEANVWVEPGGKLIIDGGHLTKALFEDYWGGIAVIGNSNLPQTQANQGYLEIINGGKISHSRTAVNNIGPGTGDNWFAWGTSGGIIYAEDAVFENNRRDVQLVDYHHWNGSVEMNYKADFINCSFIRNNDYGIESMIENITMWEVVGVNIEGCRFENSISSGGFEGAAGAIGTIAATYTVQSSAGNPSYFSGYTKAISSADISRGDKAIKIVDSRFENNHYAIYLQNTANAKVGNNNIDVPSRVLRANYGIYMDHSHNYQLSGNVLTSDATANSRKAVGMVFYNNGPYMNEVYGNKLDGFSVGLEALGINRDASHNFLGLCFKCNDFGENTKNSFDIWVKDMSNDPDPAFPTGAYGIANYQGSALGPPASLANNFFSPGITSSESNFRNDEQNIPVYFHGQGSRVVPQNTSGLAFYPASSGITGNNCPPRLIMRIDNPNTGLTELNNADLALAADIELLQQLISNGDDPQLEAQILMPENQEYQNMYINLMEMSPFVSAQELINLIAITDFPELALRNVMVANAEISRDGEVWDELTNREPPLSEQTLDDIQNETRTVTCYDVMGARITGDRQQRHNAMTALISYYEDNDAIDADTEAMNALLQSRTEPEYHYILAENLIASGNYQEAVDVLDNMPEETTINGFELEQHSDLNTYYDVVIDALTSGEGKLNQISGSGISELQNLAGDGYGISRVKARNLLALNGFENSYEEPVYIPGENKDKTTIAEDGPVSAQNHFLLFPNPAENYFYLQWNWLEAGLNKGFRVSIIDITGKQVFSREIEDYQRDRLRITFGNWPSGIYIVKLNAGEKELYRDKLIIQP